MHCVICEMNTSGIGYINNINFSGEYSTTDRWVHWFGMSCNYKTYWKFTEFEINKYWINKWSEKKHNHSIINESVLYPVQILGDEHELYNKK